MQALQSIVHPNKTETSWTTRTAEVEFSSIVYSITYLRISSINNNCICERGDKNQFIQIFMVIVEKMSSTLTEESKINLCSEEQDYDEEKDSWEVLSDCEEGHNEKHVTLDIDGLHRCVSTPNFSSRNVLLKDTDDFSDLDSTFDVQSLNTEGMRSAQVLPTASADDWSMVSNTGNFKKIPSFKDMLLMNADNKQDQARKDLQDKLQQNLMERKIITPTFVVSQVATLKRCSFSTGDLQDPFRMNKGELTHVGTAIPEDEVLGESDAMEFYHRKALGSSSRVKGLKLRPDEAKRKEYSVYKKETHRNSQNA
jgi:hypothetical protein